MSGGDGNGWSNIMASAQKSKGLTDVPVSSRFSSRRQVQWYSYGEVQVDFQGTKTSSPVV